MNVGMGRSWSDLKPQSIRKAIALWHELGSEEFISRTRFRESNRYVVVDRGQANASKSLVAMAFQLQFGCAKDGPPRLSGGNRPAPFWIVWATSSWTYMGKRSRTRRS